MSNKITHKMLVTAAKTWLHFCRVVITEMRVVSGSINEEPDAIGFKSSGESWVIECKVSRSDFLKDQKKSSRRNPRFGMGLHRLYLVPIGLIKVEELPDGWGLLEYQASEHERGYFIKRTCEYPVKCRTATAWYDNELVQKQEKQVAIVAAARALEALSLVRPLSTCPGSDTERLEARVAQLAQDRNRHDQRWREAMESVEVWRQKCREIGKRLDAEEITADMWQEARVHVEEVKAQYEAADKGHGFERMSGLILPIIKEFDDGGRGMILYNRMKGAE